MLSPKQLLAETAKFFLLNPSRFRTGGLVSGNKSLATPGLIDDDSVCFCTVGFMAARLVAEDPSKRDVLKKDGAYKLVDAFLGRVGITSNRLYGTNDSRGRVGTIDFLKERANAVS